MNGWMRASHSSERNYLLCISIRQRLRDLHMEGLAPLNQRQRLREIARAGRSSRCIASEKIGRDSVRNLNKYHTPVSLHISYPSLSISPHSFMYLFRDDCFGLWSKQQMGEPTPAS